MIEINNKSALRDSYTPGYGSGCGCGSRRYYTKDEVDALLAGIIDPDEIEQIINNLFEEYIEEGDLEQLIIDAIAGMYTNEEIDDMLAELEARIKTWVEEQGYLTDIDLTINGTTLHNGDSIDIEGGGGSDEYVKKNTVPQVVTREFLAVSPDNKITVRMTNTDTGANTEYERYIKRINGIPLITQLKQDDIELPSYSYVDTEIRDSMEAETARTESTYMKDGGITINGTVLHNGDSMTISADTSNCVKKNTVPQVVTREFLAVSPDNKITVRITDTDTSVNTDYERYIKRINDIPLITQAKQDDIYLPTLDDFSRLVDRIAELEARVINIEENCCGGGDEPERGTFVAIYNVTSTTTPTQILDSRGISGFGRAALEDNTTVPLATGYTFSQTGLQKVYYTIGSTLKSYSFWECSQLKQIIIPSGVQTIGNNAFNGCSALTGVTLSNTVTTIGESAFRRCYTLKSIALPNTVTSVGEYAFAYCTSLTGATLSTSLEAIPQGMFHSATTLSSITIPSSVSRISGSAFYACSGLTGTLTLPNSVTLIGSQTFAYCSGLSRVVIGSGIQTINPQAFYSCTGLNRITVNCSAVPYLAAPTGDPARGVFDSTNNAPIYVPSASVNAYKAATNWSAYSDRIRS